jgi:hypothetical protein
MKRKQIVVIGLIATGLAGLLSCISIIGTGAGVANIIGIFTAGFGFGALLTALRLKNKN